MKTPQMETLLRDSETKKTTLDANYVTGLCEGEASFTYNRSGKGLNLKFSMKLTESDKDLVFSLMLFFGVGNIYYVGPKEPGPRSGNTAASWFYCVTKMSDIARIIDHFDSYPLVGRKLECFKIWKQMFELKQIPRKFNAVALNTLAQTLSGMATKGRRSAKPLVYGEMNG